MTPIDGVELAPTDDYQPKSDDVLTIEQQVEAQGTQNPPPDQNPEYAANVQNLIDYENGPEYKADVLAQLRGESVPAPPPAPEPPPPEEQPA